MRGLRAAPIVVVMISYQSGVRYSLEKPEGGPESGVRFTLTLLFPKK